MYYQRTLVSLIGAISFFTCLIIPSNAVAQQDSDLPRLLASDPNAYVEELQRKLSDAGFYVGPIHGLLTQDTIQALYAHCEAREIAATCRRGPLSADVASIIATTFVENSGTSVEVAISLQSEISEWLALDRHEVSSEVLRLDGGILQVHSTGTAATDGSVVVFLGGWERMEDLGHRQFQVQIDEMDAGNLTFGILGRHPETGAFRVLTTSETQVQKLDGGWTEVVLTADGPNSDLLAFRSFARVSFNEGEMVNSLFRVSKM